MSDVPHDGRRLFQHEAELLDLLRASFDLSDALLTAFAESFRRLYETYSSVLLSSQDIHSGRVALVGLTNHTQLLVVGGLRAINDGNAHVWSCCARGLIETFGACVMISERPSLAPALLDHGIKAGKLRAAAERAQPGLGPDVDRLNLIVHPASRAIYSGIHPTDLAERMAAFKFGVLRAPREESLEGITVLANLAALLADRLSTLAEDPLVLEAGKRVMIRTPGSQPI